MAFSRDLLPTSKTTSGKSSSLAVWGAYKDPDGTTVSSRPIYTPFARRRSTLDSGVLIERSGGVEERCRVFANFRAISRLEYSRFVAFIINLKKIC